MAYHLHRLNLTGEPLRTALNGKLNLTTALSQGRVGITHDFITALATNLNIAADELLRDLLEEESNEWAFYRVSARNKQAVWKQASETWKSRGYSLREAANIIGMDPANLLHVVQGTKTRVFDLSQPL